MPVKISHNQNSDLQRCSVLGHGWRLKKELKHLLNFYKGLQSIFCQSPNQYQWHTRYINYIDLTHSKMKTSCLYVRYLNCIFLTGTSFITSAMVKSVLCYSDWWKYLNLFWSKYLRSRKKKTPFFQFIHSALGVFPLLSPRPMSHAQSIFVYA